MNDQEAMAAFAALSNVTRLKLLKALVRAGPAGLNAGALADAVSATPSRTSFHLAAMSETGMITSTRQARQIIYAVDFARMGEIVTYLMSDCCADAPALLECCAGGAASR